MKMINAGSSRIKITPPKGISLAGYFNPRPNSGVLDDLYVKVLLLENEGTVAGFVCFDLCFVGTELVESMKKEMLRKGLKFKDNLIFSATHTHTGPQTSSLFGMEPDRKYIGFLVKKTADAVASAYARLAPAELLAGKANENPFAFNRRYFMKDGKVLTNPGKLNPGIVRPEGPVDREISIFAVRQDNKISTMLVNIVNHTDTIGGDLVSADWPGLMEKEIRSKTGDDVSVLTFIGCSGNINHFDVSHGKPQTSYEEAKRIGKGYAGIILGKMKSLKPVKASILDVKSHEMNIPFRKISAIELDRAKAVLSRTGKNSGNGNMTSEGLASGEGPIARFFAGELVEFKRKCSGRSRSFKIISIKLGEEISFLSLPGEPFTEIGLSIKKRSKFKHNFIITNAMGRCGYVPLKECFRRGGYETLPVVGGGAREDTAERMIGNGIKLLNRRF